MLFIRNKPYTNETLLAKEDILELIQFERFCRDNSLWDSMESCFAEDSYVNISWFKGTGHEFVVSSREMNRYAPHQIHNSQIWINDTRAIAIMQATIQTRLPIQNVEMELQSDAKLVYCVEKDDQGVWYITRLECIYEKDSLTPVKPTTINLPKQDFEGYRQSYACLSYALNEIGYDVNSELQGIDRPDEVNAYYEDIDSWLTFKEKEASIDMKKIDLHAHYISPRFSKFLDKYFNGKGDGVATPPFSPEGYLDLMNRMEIEYGVLSISSPHISAAPDNEMVELAKEVNDYASSFIHKYPEQLGFFATLPLPLVDESIATIDEALDQQGALGFTLPTNARGVYIGDDRLDSVLAKLNERHALVALHPNEPKPNIEAMSEVVPAPLMEFIFDTTRTIIYMSQNNVFSKYPNIKWIVPHCGALLPVIAQRVSMGNKMFGSERQPDDLEQVMKELYFDLAGKVLPYQLPNLAQCVDMDKIVYGSDAPYTTDQVVTLLADELESTELISRHELETMLYDNGKQLIKTVTDR